MTIQSEWWHFDYRGWERFPLANIPLEKLADPAAAHAAAAFAPDWPRFRGNNGDGLSTDATVPLDWSDTTNVKWRLDLPGPGSSSPVIAGGRVYVTAYSGYGEKPGESEDPAAKGDPFVFHVVDIYVADPLSAAADRPMPGKWIASGSEGLEGQDLDPDTDKFKFAVPAGSVPSGSKLVAVVTYVKDDGISGNANLLAVPGAAVTGPVSLGLQIIGGAPISNVVAALDAGSVKLTLTGGTAPFQLQKRSTLTGTWLNEGAAFSGQTTTIPASGDQGYFRVLGQ